MAWLKIDDQFPDHPKIVEAGPLASWLHVCGMAYCARYLTNGFIPDAQLRKLADVEDAAALAERLVAANGYGEYKYGLWKRVEGGFQVHDYLDYNPSADQVRALRKARAQAGRSGGLESARSKAQAKAQPSDEANENQNSTPSPSPFPDPSPSPAPVVVGDNTPTPPTGLSAGRQHNLSPDMRQKVTDTLKRPLVPSDIWHWSGLVEMYGEETVEYAVNEAFVCGKEHWAYIDTVAEAQHERHTDEAASIRDPP